MKPLRPCSYLILSDFIVSFQLNTASAQEVDPYNVVCQLSAGEGETVQLIDAAGTIIFGTAGFVGPG